MAAILKRGVLILTCAMASNCVMAECPTCSSPRLPVAATDCKNKTIPNFHSDKPEVSTNSMGFFSTGAALVDLNQDGYAEMIFSNGNDMGVQQMTVFEHQGPNAEKRYLSRPTWLSETTEYHGHLCVGDLNQDGCPDVVTTVYFGKYLNFREGKIHVYLNKKSADGKTCTRFGANSDKHHPDYKLKTHGWTMNCDLADVDGDGDLDIAVAISTNDDDKYNDGGGGRMPEPGQSLIFFNDGGFVNETPGWLQGGTKCKPGHSDPDAACNLSYAGDVEFADYNLDGNMDLAIGGALTKIYYGNLDQSTGLNVISEQPGWTSKDSGNEMTVSLAMDSNWSVDMQEINLAVTHAISNQPTTIYSPQRTTAPTWSTNVLGQGAAVVLKDINGDNLADLITGSLEEKNSDEFGGPIRIYLGTPGGFPKQPDACLKPVNTVVAESIVTGKMKLESSDTNALTSIMTLKANSHLMILPTTEHLRKVTRVARLNKGNYLDVARTQYSYLHGENWVSVTKTFSDDQQYEIDYEVLKFPDLLVSDFKVNTSTELYNNGNFIFCNHHNDGSNCNEEASQ